MNQNYDTDARSPNQEPTQPGLTRAEPFAPRTRVVGYPGNYQTTRGIVDETVSFLLSMFLV